MIKRLDIFANKIKVGTLALTNENKVAFQYTDEWIEKGFSLNPFKLPLSKQLFFATTQHFKGLFGVFADSLPDSYGELLLDRYLKSKNINAKDITCLDRLAYVGRCGMGLLEYVPDFSAETDRSDVDFDVIQKECNDLLDSKKVDNIAELFSLGGSSGGARPKALIRKDGEEYIVKFSSKFDPKNIAELEYRYMSLAHKSGINVPEIQLVTSKKGNKFFMIKRFDRRGEEKVHMITAAALLEVDFRAPSLDYNELVKLTRVLTKNDDDVLDMYRRMVFNVLIDNQDDHAKNFSFLFDNQTRTYRLSPAYDITLGKTYYGEHTTSVNGKGKNITDEDMLLVASKNLIDKEVAESIIDRCKKVLKTR